MCMGMYMLCATICQGLFISQPIHLSMYTHTHVYACRFMHTLCLLPHSPVQHLACPPLRTRLLRQQIYVAQRARAPTHTRTPATHTSTPPSYHLSIHMYICICICSRYHLSIHMHICICICSCTPTHKRRHKLSSVSYASLPLSSLSTRLVSYWGVAQGFRSLLAVISCELLASSAYIFMGALGAAASSWLAIRSAGLETEKQIRQCIGEEVGFACAETVWYAAEQHSTAQRSHTKGKP